MAETKTTNNTPEELLEQAREEARRELAEKSQQYVSLFGPTDGPTWLAEGLTEGQCWERQAKLLREQLTEQTKLHEHRLGEVTRERDNLLERINAIALGEKAPVTLEEQRKAPAGIPIRIAAAAGGAGAA
jgi:hypothetical protein